jgi:exosome complex RNA-binding protein Rrp42 (RNase PH superfamily)
MLILHSADILPLSSLCIHPGKSAWVLYVDATCINYDGNAFDAALVAMVAALRNSMSLPHPSLLLPHQSPITAQLPKPTYDPETGLTTCSRTIREPLQINCMPISMTFGIFDSYVPFFPRSSSLLTFHPSILLLEHTLSQTQPRLKNLFLTRHSPLFLTLPLAS